MLKTKHLALSLFLGFFVTQSFAQGLGNSPYSPIGLGDISNGTSVANDMMGGTGVSFGGRIGANLQNPAMLVKNSFVGFNIGLSGQNKTINTSSASQKVFGMGLQYLSFVFPTNKKWTMGINLQPYSRVDYKATLSKSVVGENSKVLYNFESVGGVTKVGLGNGFQIGKSLYAGFELGYLLGSIQRDTTSQLILGTSQNYYIRYGNRLSFSKGGVLKAGLAYQQKLSKKWQLNVGGTYEISSSLKAEQLRSVGTLIDNGTGPSKIKATDTLGVYTGSVRLPSRYRVGISLESPYKLTVAAEYSVQDWSTFKNMSNSTSSYLGMSKTMNFGVEYIPNATSTKYFNQVFYRVGFQNQQTPYIVNGMMIKDQSITFGMSVPMAYRSANYIDLGFALGRRGTTSNNLVLENYFKINVGFSLIDARWFLKPKID